MNIEENVKKTKTIKDSIHGYIEIEKEYMELFIDTPLFQRLGRIEQTSMRVLYPSARHDRFIHSIGVFFLGKKAFEYFKDNIKCDTELLFNEEVCDWDCWKKSFEIACLLHDVGHAPFSHTCEDFYKEKQIDCLSLIVWQLFQELKLLLCTRDYEEFISDFEESSPSSHEIVSSIVILKFYSKSITEINADINLVIRSIVGCVYIDTSNEKGIKNCLIRMLNSQVIDVDKLDYITRDSNLTGFANANIDTDRLLKSFTAVKESENDYYPAYNKNALSVIQNVIFANNAQQAWIVNHHVVIYNSYLIQASLNEISKKINTKNPTLFKNELFSVDSLIGTKNCCNKFKVNMLSDDDLWHLFKLYQDEIPVVRELINRNFRKKALWKSFAEFTLLFDENKREYKTGDFDFEKFKEMFRACCDDAKEFENHLFNQEKATSNNKKISKAGLDFCEIISDFTLENNINNDDFVILAGGSLSKNKAVISRDKLRIKFFTGKDGTKRYDKVMNLIPHEDIENNETNKIPFFFLFHTESIDKIKLCDFIKNHPKLRFREST